MRRRSGRHDTYFVVFHILEQRYITTRVEVIGIDRATFLSRWQGEGPNTCEYVRDDIIFLEDVNDPRVFEVKPGIPVDFSEVECKVAVILFLRGPMSTLELQCIVDRTYMCDHSVGLPGQDLHGEYAEHIVDCVRFAYNGAYVGIFLRHSIGSRLKQQWAVITYV